MSDYISRQAAIDALFGLYEYQRDIDPTEAADLVRQGIYLAEKKIDQLPSVQPDLDEWCNTCREYDTERHCCPRFNKVIREALKDAQPEVVHCRDCRYENTGECEYKFGLLVANDENFCSYGERRKEE